MTPNVSFKGVPIYLNGTIYILPSLSLRQVEEFNDILSQARQKAFDDPKGLLALFSVYLPVVGAALRRNYPDVTDDQLRDWLDLESFGEAVKAVQNASGYTTVTSPGEAQPAAPTGDTSTAR